MGAVAGACALTLFSFGSVARHITGDFRPCHALVLDTDQLSKWWVVPNEIQAWFDRKPEACRAGRTPIVSDLPRISWGVYDPETDERGEPFQWTSARATFFLKERGTFRLRVRDRSATAAAPGRATLSSGGVSVKLTLTSAEWASVAVPVSGRLSWLRGASIVTLTAERSFVPQERDPSSPDRRRLGVQIQY
jgi:hypothetical protein